MQLRTFLALGFLLALPVVGLAQGPLTPPPGAPAPTMKSLSDLDAKLTALVAKADPRTPLSQATMDAAGGHITINTSGSYYLTSNLTNATNPGWAWVINITAPDVTLDLNGYTVSITGNASYAVYISAPAGGVVISNVTVRNGTLLGPKIRTAGANPWNATFTGGGGFSRGIYCQKLTGTGSNHFRFEGVTARGFSNGFDLNDSGFEQNGGRAILSRCHAIDCEGAGVIGQFLDLADVVVSGCNTHGIRADYSTLERIVIERCGGDGVVGGSNTLRGVAVNNLGGTGFQLGGNSRASDIVVSNAARGVFGTLITLQGVSAQNNRGHGLEVSSSTASGFMLCGNTGSGLSGSHNILTTGISQGNGGHGLDLLYSTISGFTLSGNTNSGLSGNYNSLTDGIIQGNISHGIYSPGSSVRNVTASSNGDAGIYCDNSSITGCVAHNNAADGIRGISSVLADCRAYANDTTPGGYAGVGIAWGSGKITNSLADTASPAIP
ncbi:MAG: right-handed parallel beta-helix repeat-containing protein [Verrucomicrobiota bacterium]